MPSVASSASTIKSFYTIAEQKRAAAAAATAAGTCVGATRKKKKHGYFVNRSIDLTEYLCLPARLTQSLFNPYTLIFALVAVHVQVFSAVVLWGLHTAENDSIVNCQMSALQADRLGRTAPLYVGQAIDGAAQAAIDNTNKQALDNANATVTVQQSQAAQYIELLGDSYATIAKSCAESGYNAASNATGSIHSWVDKQLKKAESVTAKEIHNLTKGIEELRQSLDNSSLFTGTKLQGTADVSLEEFKQISVPTDVSANISRLNDAARNFQMGSLVSESIKGVYSLKLPTKFDRYSSGFGPGIGTNLQNISSSTECPLEQQITNIYTDLCYSVDKVATNCLWVCGAFAIVAIGLRALCEVQHWKCIQAEAKSLEMGGYKDAVGNINDAGSPLVVYAARKVADHFTRNERSRLLVHWSFNYVFSQAAMTVLTAALYLLLATIMLLSASKAVLDTPPESVLLETSVGGDQNNAISNYGLQANSFIEQAERTTNSQLDKYYQQASDHIHAAVVSAGVTMRQGVERQFGSLDNITGIADLSANYDNYTINYSGTKVTIPRVNTTALEIPGNTASAISTNTGSVLQKVQSLCGMIISIHLQVGLGLLTSWFIITILASIYAIVKNRI